MHLFVLIRISLNLSFGFCVFRFSDKDFNQSCTKIGWHLLVKQNSSTQYGVTIMYIFMQRISTDSFINKNMMRTVCFSGNG